VNGYRGTSVLNSTRDGTRLDLETALAVTPTGLVENPVFFTGFVTRPDITAAGLLAVADVAGSRYADAGLAARLASLDPVVTAGGDRLRFESFSACNGVHARFDLLPDGLGSSEVGHGTTNIDVNQPLRTALARVDRATPLHLAVGADELRASSPEATHVERTVALPDRWVRGLAEVPALAAAMTPVAELRGPAIGQFLASLPRTAPPGPKLHVVPMPGRWRTTTATTPTGFPLPGAARLRGLDRIARHATRLVVHANPHGSTAWVLDVPGARLTLVLSPDPFRGFSGEGTLLTLLTRPDAEMHGRTLADHLDWSGLIDPTGLATATGQSDGDVASGLAWLAASGRLGYDLVDHAWFHRELPIDSEKILRRHPRLTSAQALAADGAVNDDGPDGTAWTVRGTRDTYTVTTRGDSHTGQGGHSLSTSLVCTCPWETEHASGRGPCKHILAVVIQLRADEPTHAPTNT
jgi:hypothetical protein